MTPTSHMTPINKKGLVSGSGKTTILPQINDSNHISNILKNTTEKSHNIKTNKNFMRPPKDSTFKQQSIITFMSTQSSSIIKTQEKIKNTKNPQKYTHPCPNHT